MEKIVYPLRGAWAMGPAATHDGMKNYIDIQLSIHYAYFIKWSQMWSFLVVNWVCSGRKPLVSVSRPRQLRQQRILPAKARKVDSETLSCDYRTAHHMETLRFGISKTASGVLPHGGDDQRHAPAPSVEGEESFSRRTADTTKGFLSKGSAKSKNIK
jgi:hypothetical protein